jgi:hypothetical protein
MKITKSYSIEEDIYKSFDKLTERLKINKSSFIEDKIIDYLKENGVSDFDTYYLITDPNYEVTIENRDDTYLYLSDGSKIIKTMFDSMLKKVEKMNPSDPPTIDRQKPLVIKLIIKEYEKKTLFVNKINEYKSNNSNSLIGKKFRSLVDNKIFKVVEDQLKYVAIIDDDITINNRVNGLVVKKDLFFLNFKMEEEQVYISFGDYAFEYIGLSRIDGYPIFKLGGGLFREFFSNDLQSLKKYMTDRKFLTIFATNRVGEEKIFLDIYEIERIKMLEDQVAGMFSNETDKKNEIEKLKKEIETLNEVMNICVKSGIEASKMSEFDNIEQETFKNAMDEALNSGIEAGHFPKSWWEIENEIPGGLYTKIVNTGTRKIKTGNEIDDMKSSYEISLDNIENNLKDEKKDIQFMELMKDCLFDIRNGEFKSEFSTSNQIRKFIKSLDVIKVSDPDSELAKVKYQLLLEIVKLHNTKY